MLILADFENIVWIVLFVIIVAWLIIVWALKH
jgi:hypothetical protein